MNPTNDTTRRKRRTTDGRPSQHMAETTPNPDSPDEVRTASVPYDRSFGADEGPRNPVPKAPASEAIPEFDEEHHTKATMPPGMPRDPKRNTL